MHKISFLVLFLLNHLIINAQNSITALKISYANDLFTGTDQYFTQGIRVELISPLFKKSPVSYLNFLPKKDAVIYHSVAIQQDGFTPTSIRHDTVLKGDRPFCGSTFITNSVYAFSESKKVIYHTQLDLGAIGPVTLGFEEQTAIHKAINNILPKGWRNQIQNDLILNYKIELQQTLVYRKLVDLSVNSQLRAGTMFTDASLGGQVRIGLKNNWHSSNTVHNTDKLQIIGFTKSQLRAVAYNATLQGGIINRSSVYTISSRDLQRLVTQTEFGIVASYKNILAEYSQSYINKEFKTGMPHAWGKISMMIGF